MVWPLMFFYWTRITRISRIILCFLTMGPKPPVLTPPNKNIRVIREIRVQKPYASRINKDYPRPQKNYPCNPCSEPYASRINKAIRVIRAIRVQNPYASRKYKEYPRSQKASVKSVFKPPYASRLNKDIRVPRQKKHPCSDLPSNCLETRNVHCFVGSGQFS